VQGSDSDTTNVTRNAISIPRTLIVVTSSSLSLLRATTSLRTFIQVWLLMAMGFEFVDPKSKSSLQSGPARIHVFVIVGTYDRTTAPVVLLQVP
jgi:hypothetical protein